MRKTILMCAAFLGALMACGDSEDGSENGTGVQLLLPVVSATNVAVAVDAPECIRFTGSTFVRFTASSTTSTPDDCLLVAVRVPDEAPDYWVSGHLFDIELRTPDYDGDPVRHSTASTEDTIQSGTFSMRVYERDSPSFEENEDVLWSGEMTVERGASTDEIRVQLR